MTEKKVFAKEISVKRIFPEDLQSNFASHFVIQHDLYKFILTFYEVWPPVLLGETGEDVGQVIDNIDSIEAKCIARIVVTPEKMREFYEAIQNNLQKYEQLSNAEIIEISEE